MKKAETTKEKRVYEAPSMREIPVQLCDCIAGSAIAIKEGTSQIKEIREDNVNIVLGGKGRL
ncbi:hypothetical protein BACPLE_00043 [Phocaeicola plebeius DSM 17135]|uniref:Uncharacterized protein n=1 Tax=Phocaeicola plebeius (strain DSM 17135 / JCM 12973 / CCUG 54634 / M2) TaxID=484018 RepID=B5CU09_PHOPM|nr:hypothetical protein [Phocaeicola plebeius]EDY97256.1 hypothetical protein BACPLE_00043 [Phocaeicola plebeius DSM 17135]